MTPQTLRKWKRDALEYAFDKRATPLHQTGVRIAKQLAQVIDEYLHFMVLKDILDETNEKTEALK